MVSKRIHTPNPNGVITIFPILDWCKCEFCDNEVRREKVYEWISQGRFYQYACKECVVSITDCNDKIERQHLEILSKRPKIAPTAPPLRTISSTRR